MRRALLSFVLLSVAASAHAEGARENRYGPTTTRRDAASAASYTGPMLGWASRPAQPVAAPQAAAPGARYQPVAVAPAATGASLPDSLYARPAAPASQPTSVSIPSPPPRQVAAVMNPTAGGHFYSVARESGLTPDPIPPAGPDTRVLISAEAPAPPPEDATPVHGSADWLAAGVAGDDDQDDNGDRRAKTRNQAQ